MLFDEFVYEARSVVRQRRLKSVLEYNAHYELWPYPVPRIMIYEMSAAA